MNELTSGPLRWLLLLAVLTSPAHPSPGRAAEVPPAGPTALVNVNLIPMTGEKILPHQTVLTDQGRIVGLGPAEGAKVPEGARVIEGQGGFLMPGLADMHVHLRDDWPVPQLNLYLAHGVTTVRDLDGRPDMLRWREEIRAGKRAGPHIYASCPTIRGFEDRPSELVGRRVPGGYDCLKLYSFFSRPGFERTMARAKKEGWYTVGHLPIAPGLEGAIAAGMDEIAHLEELSWEFFDFDRQAEREPLEWYRYLVTLAAGLRENHPDPDSDYVRRRLARVVDRVKAAGLRVCTTLAVNETVSLKLTRPRSFLDREESRYLPAGFKRAFRAGQDKHQLIFADHYDLAPVIVTWLKMLAGRLHRAGVDLVLGTDAGPGGLGIVPGFSLLDELELMVDSNLSPYEAIAAATRRASETAAAMTGADQFGTVEVGKRADLILLPANPLDDLAHLRQRLGVMAAGRWYERSELERMIALPPSAGRADDIR